MERWHPCRQPCAGPAPVQVLVHWACDKISAAAATLPDEQLLEALQVR